MIKRSERVFCAICEKMYGSNDDKRGKKLASLAFCCSFRSQFAIRSIGAYFLSKTPSDKIVAQESACRSRTADSCSNYLERATRKFLLASCPKKSLQKSENLDSKTTNIQKKKIKNASLPRAFGPRSLRFRKICKKIILILKKNRLFM